MIKKWTALLAVAALTATTACGTDGKDNQADKGSAPGTVKELEPAELTFFSTTNNFKVESFDERYGNKIREKFPTYKINYIVQENAQTLPNLIATGQTIDVLLSSIGHTSAYLTNLNMQHDISDLIKTNNYDLSVLEPTTVEIQRQIAKGGMYGLPVSTSTMSLFYNRDLFDKFGVAYPKDGMTWDEVYELARKMTRNEGGIQYKGFTMAFQHAMFLNQNSANFVELNTSKALLDSEEFKKTLLNYARFFQIPGNEMPNNKYALGSQQKPFLTDHTGAMFLTLNSPIKDDPASPNWDVVQAPSYPDKPGVGMQSYPNYAYMTTMSKNKQAAFNVMAYLTSLDYQQWMVENGYGFSALKDTKLVEKYGINTPHLKTRNLKGLMAPAFAPPTVKGEFQALGDKEGYQALSDYLDGTDINTALRNAKERLDKAITAEKGK